MSELNTIVWAANIKHDVIVGIQDAGKPLPVDLSEAGIYVTLTPEATETLIKQLRSAVRHARRRAKEVLDD